MPRMARLNYHARCPISAGLPQVPPTHNAGLPKFVNSGGRSLRYNAFPGRTWERVPDAESSNSPRIVGLEGIGDFAGVLALDEWPCPVKLGPPPFWKLTDSAAPAAISIAYRPI